jgi:hypothetical protein
MSMGWSWARPSSVKTTDPLTEGEDACEKLLDVIETNNQDREQIKQKVTALRKIREQNHRLILMGYLD